MKPRTGLAALAAVLVLSSPAWAHHEGTLGAAGGFAAGIAHPWFGLDHLLAMVAVGLLAAQMRGRALWVLPVAFLGTMVVGGAIGMGGVELPLMELGIALSVFALGVALAWGHKFPLAAAAACTGAVGLVHGNAHGAEMPTLAQPALYACGFLLATALLHALGIVGGLATSRHGAMVMRFTGAALTGAGVLMLGRAL